MEKKQLIFGQWPKLLTIELAAAYIGLSPKTLRNRLGRRAAEPFPVKPKRLGRGKIVFLREDLERYAEQLPYEDYASHV